MPVKFELLIVYDVNALDFIWLIKGFVCTLFVAMEVLTVWNKKSPLIFNNGLNQ